jgi:hypothetical protein
MDGTDFDKIARESFIRHEELIRSCFNQLDVVNNTLAEIRADLDAGVTKKPKVTIHTSSSNDPNITLHIRLKSGTYPALLPRSNILAFLQGDELYGLPKVVQKLFGDRFYAAVKNYTSVYYVTISPQQYLWESLPLDQAEKVVKSAIRLVQKTDLDDTKKKRIHERRILFNRIRKVIDQATRARKRRDYIYTKGKEEPIVAEIPPRDIFINLVMHPNPNPDFQDFRGSKTDGQNLFIETYCNNINPNKSRWSQEKKYRQVNYKLTRGDAEQLVDELLVKQTMET